MKDPINQVTSDSLIKIKPEHVSVEIDGEILAMHSEQPPAKAGGFGLRL